MSASNCKTFEEAAEFHGHVCPGLALGYRVGTAALEWLESNRSKDEEIVAVVENDSCAVDAIQVLTGCTFGKGNLIYNDTGKRVYSFYNRDRNRGVRIVEDYVIAETPGERELFAKSRAGGMTADEMRRFEEFKEKKINSILNDPAESFISVEEISGPPPEKARIHETLRCDACGEKVMAPKAVRTGNRVLCRDCFDIE